MFKIYFNKRVCFQYLPTTDKKNGYMEDFIHFPVTGRTSLLFSNENMYDRYGDLWKNYNIVLYWAK